MSDARPQHFRSPASGTVAWAIAGLALIAIFGGFLRFVSSDPLGIDSWWFGVVSIERGSAWHAIAVFMAEAGSGIGAASCSAIAAALLLALRRPRDAAAVATAMVLGVAASELSKALVLRPRPWDQLYSATGSSYPSGHSMGAAALAVSLLLVALGSELLSRSTTRWIAVAAITWVLVMMWSRTALHVHWLTDVLAGALLGLCAALLARRLCSGPAQARPVSGRAVRRH